MGPLTDRLLRQAEEIADEGHPGWGNTMTEASARIEELERRLALALPVARAAIGWADGDDEGVLMAEVAALKAGERAEILEGGVR